MIEDTSKGDETVVAIRDHVKTLPHGQKANHGAELYGLMWQIRRLPEANLDDYPECER